MDRLYIKSQHNSHTTKRRIIMADMQELNELFIKYCIKGDLESVKSVVEKGVNPNYNNYEGATHAIQHNHVNLLKYLHQQGYDILQPEAIQLACQTLNFAIIQYLIENKAPANLGFRAAQAKGNIDIIKYLIAHGGMKR